jgi:DNA-directed RNA polymerase alpha subunit
MKATLTTTFTETQLKEILNSLTISDCKKAVAFLQKRIQLAEEKKRKKTGGIRKWDDDFLNMSLEEFDLHPRIMNRLRENDLTIVKNITELGIDKLTMFRGIGESTAKEIKREIFNNPS